MIKWLKELFKEEPVKMFNCKETSIKCSRYGGPASCVCSIHESYGQKRPKHMTG